MPDFFDLDLDTTAPSLAWGSVTGVGRDRIVIARYTVDEPGVVAAQFIDAANSATNLAVFADRLTGRIPAGAAYGQGVIRAWLQDDVGNTSVRSLYVTLAPTAHIELDTTPPVITWGPVDGTEATEVLTVRYAINEPTLLTAELQLSDGRHLPMQVASDRLTVTLPGDTPDGLATVSAFVRDEVGNDATRTLIVLLSGVLPRPTTRPFQGGGLPRRVIGPRIVTSSRSRLHATSSAASEAALHGETRVRVQAEYGRSHHLVRMASAAVVRSRGDHVAVIAASPSVVISSAHFDLAKRSEGPNAEAELLLVLGLL